MRRCRSRRRVDSPEVFRHAGGMVVSLLKYRRLIWRHAVSELRYRYAGTGLGVVWNVLHPLALIAVYSVVFSAILQPARLQSLPATAGRFGYLLYLCSGLL